jgi:hypothetical protein
MTRFYSDMSHAVDADVNSGIYKCRVCFRVGWDWVHLTCQPLFGLLYQHRVISERGAVVEWKLARETEVLGKNCPSATLPIKNPAIPDLESTPGRNGGKPATNRLSYGTVGRRIAYRPMECPLWLPCWVQIQTLSTVSLNWSIRMSSTFTSWREPSKYS